jgi:multidrug efflux pump subunit AcrB
VVLSLAVSLTLVPLLSLRALRPAARPGRGPGRLAHGYLRVLRPCLRHPAALVAGAVALLLAGALSLRSIPSGFLPSMDEGAFVLDYFLPAGTSLTETDAVARKIEAVLRHTPEIETYSRRTGAELGPATATMVSRGDIMVRLRPRAHRARSAEQIIAAVRAEVARAVPEARTEFVQVLQDVLNDLAGTPRPIEIKIFGDDYVVLRRLGGEVAARIKDVVGLVDLYPGFEDESPELRFRIDAAQAARFGKTAADVADDLETSLRGTIAGTFRRPDRPINIRVRFPDEVRFDPRQVAALALAWSSSGAVPVAAAAPLTRGSVPTQLTRENLRRVVIVTADHEDRDLGGVVRDARARLVGLALPEGYHLELGGQFEGQQQTLRAIGVVLAFGLLAVLVVLMAQFRRARHAFLVLATAPLALVGALLTLLVADVPLNASSLMGCVLLVGLVVKNGILLLEQFEIATRPGVTVEEALAVAGSLRVRPILMTTIATLAGLAPLALGIGAGAEVQRPLALAVIGGLSVSTVVSLLVLPALVRLSWGTVRRERAH